MKLATIERDGPPTSAVVTSSGYLPLDRLNARTRSDWPTTLDDLLSREMLPDFASWWSREAATALSDAADDLLPEDAVRTAVPYRPAGKIWGIGLNYRDHAGDLGESVPEGLPGSFLKPTTTVIGQGDTIRIPRMSERTTAEAELGIVIGATCRNVPREQWLDVVAGFTTVIDMTAEDILRRNPRYLTLCKSFDTFFAFGPEIVTPDEIDDVLSLQVTTVHNGRDHAGNTVADMTYPPDDLVELHSEVMTLHPGDIISTGTPGAAPIQHGDRVTCRIPGFRDLSCPVVHEKVVPSVA